MALSVRMLEVVSAGLVLLLILLTAVAVYSLSQIQTLSLPISQVLAIATVILPFATAFSIQTASRLLRSRTSHIRLLIYLALFAFQLIYETIVATWSLTYMASKCGVEEKWAKLFSNKDGDAIQKIQDTFNCCGLNTLVDRAWPFPRGRPEDHLGADQCKRLYGRDRTCAGPWRQAQQINSGLLFTVATTIFVAKLVLLLFQRRNNSSWMRLIGSLTITGDLDAHSSNGANERLMISEGDQVATEEPYLDEIDVDREESTTAANIIGNGNRPRVEPSRLAATHGGEVWREEA